MVSIPHWALKKVCKDQSVLGAWLHHPSFLMASHVLLLLCSMLSNAQTVIRVFSGGSKKLSKAAEEKAARDWLSWSCIDARTELERKVVRLVSIQFARNGGSPKKMCKSSMLFRMKYKMKFWGQ